MDNGTLISPGMVVAGTVRGKGPLIVQGRIDGRILLDGELRVAPRATVHADVEVDNLDLQGQIKGTVKARQGVTLDGGSQTDGTIESPRIEIDPQARVKGRLVMPLNLPRGIKVPSTARDPWAS
jgi:cytoskeletal protein CcmA (bactofilin family)